MIRGKNQSICISFRERNRKCQGGKEKSIWMHLVHGECLMMITLIIPGCWRTVDDFYVDASGAWRAPNDDYIDESGAWRRPGDQYIDHSGEWRN